jgi:hypothetical protein
MDGLKKRFPIYSRLIKLYPVQYRREYGKQILQTTADMLDNSGRGSGKLLTWSKIALDLPLNIVKQQFQYVGGIYTKETPVYIKVNGILTSLLLLPFFAALIANGLDKVINNHTLYNSWVWRHNFIRLWVLVLPETAVLIAFATLLFYAVHNTANQPRQQLRRIFDFRHNWPIAASGLVALSILFMLRFHDSAPCWIRIPKHYLMSHQNQDQACRNYHFTFGSSMPLAPSR